MKVRFTKAFYKNWFTFPMSIVFETDLVQYIERTNILSFHFLWWHFAWIFEFEGR